MDRINWLCAAITVALIGCSAIPMEVVWKDDGYDRYEFDGTIVEPCASVNHGCTFQLAIADDPNLAEVFVPWGTKLFTQVKDAEVYAHVHVVVVDRGNGSYVLRSMKEIR